MKKQQSIFYHSTAPERWEAIKKEGVLWGIHGWGEWSEKNKKKEKCTYRYTYLSPRPLLTGYGSVILKVKFTPKLEDQGKVHNYGFDPPPGEECWQFSVFEPIPLSQVRRSYWYSFLHYLIKFYRLKVFQFKGRWYSVVNKCQCIKPYSDCGNECGNPYCQFSQKKDGVTQK